MHDRCPNLHIKPKKVVNTEINKLNIIISFLLDGLEILFGAIYISAKNVVGFISCKKLFETFPAIII